MENWEKAAESRLLAAELTLGKPAPDFTLKDINGKTVSLKDFHGKVVLLDFWVTWCGPSIHELPELKAIYEKHKHNPDFALISISSDFDDETVAKFVANNEMPWIHIRETEEMQVKFSVIGIPHYTVIDKNGLIREDNLRGGIQLNAVISSLLAEAPGEPDSANIAKLHELRADLHNRRGEREQAIQVAMDNDLDDGYLAKRIKGMTNRISAIRDRSAFKAFTEAVPKTEQDRRTDEANRKLNEFTNERIEARNSFLLVKADGEIFMGVILSSTGHLLVPDSVADATDIRAKMTDYLPAVARDSEARLAVIKIQGADDLRPVEMGTVDDLKEYAPYNFAMANGRTSRSFPTIVLVTPRGYSGNSDVGQIAVLIGDSVGTLEIDKAGNVTSFQIGSSESKLGDAFVHYDGKLLGFCVEDEVVYKGSAHSMPGPKCNVAPIDQIQASLERMGVTEMLGD